MSDFGAVEGIRDEGPAAMLNGLPDDAVDEDGRVDPDRVDDGDITPDDEQGA